MRFSEDIGTLKGLYFLCQTRSLKNTSRLFSPSGSLEDGGFGAMTSAETSSKIIRHKSQIETVVNVKRM